MIVSGAVSREGNEVARARVMRLRMGSVNFMLSIGLKLVGIVYYGGIKLEGKSCFKRVTSPDGLN